MELIKIIFTPFLSTLVLILALIVDGKLITDKPKYKKIKPIAFISLIVITFLINLYGAISSNENLKESKRLAKDQEIRDSSRIADLQRQSNELIELSKTNISKSDSIKYSVVDNAVKTLEEQRHIIEQQRENTFLQLKNELRENLYKIIVYYEEKQIRRYTDTTLFIATRLNNKYLKEYTLISTQPKIITAHLRAEEYINFANSIADQLVDNNNKAERILYINNILNVVNEINTYLQVIYFSIRDLKSYKEYENMDFNITPPHFNNRDLEEQLKYK